MPGSTDRDRGYWRDVGTLDSYYDAHMDLVVVHPVFNLYNAQWPIFTYLRPAAAGEVRRGRRRPAADADDVDAVARVSSSPAGTVDRSVLSPDGAGRSGRRGRRTRC